MTSPAAQWPSRWRQNFLYPFVVQVVERISQSVMALYCRERGCDHSCHQLIPTIIGMANNAVLKIAQRGKIGGPICWTDNRSASLRPSNFDCRRQAEETPIDGTSHFVGNRDDVGNGDPSAQMTD